MSLTVLSSALTHSGRWTSSNEDSFFADDARGLYAVSDGVGGCSKPALASRLAVEAVSLALAQLPSQDMRHCLSWAVREAHRRVQEESAKDSSGLPMAATLTLLSILEGEFHIAHVGDSRAYLFREGRLQQITHDHSVAFEQYWIGAITKEDIRNHPNQNLLTRTLGGGDLVTPDFLEGRIEPGDRFLLCSDGLTKELSDPEIALILVQRSNPELTCQKFLEAALQAGGRDNITVVVVDLS